LTPTVDIARWGDWDRPAAADVPAELVGPLAEWMRDGGPVTDPAMAALLHRKLGQMMRVHVAALELVDRLRDDTQAEYRRAVEPLSGPVQPTVGELYRRGYQQGRVCDIDARLADLMRIRDALSMEAP
jgi:hypothetical protein